MMLKGIRIPAKPSSRQLAKAIRSCRTRDTDRPYDIAEKLYRRAVEDVRFGIATYAYVHKGRFLYVITKDIEEPDSVRVSDYLYYPESGTYEALSHKVFADDGERLTERLPMGCRLFIKIE